MEHVWLKSYPPGVDPEIDVSEFSSIVAVFESTVSRFRDKPAFANMGRNLTYSELERQSRDFAAFLGDELKLKKGDRVAIMMPNLLQYPVALFGVLRAGLIVVNTNPLYTSRELKHQLSDSGASAIVILDNFAHILEKVLPETSVKTVITTSIGDLLAFPKSALVNFVVKYVKRMVPRYNIPGAIAFESALSTGSKCNFAGVKLTHEDIAFLQYTGGTTGVAKGAMLTHGNIVTNMQQASAWIAPFLEDGKEVAITALPLYHIFALTANCLLLMKLGGLNYLITNPRDMKGFVNELKNVRFTIMTGVNTLFNGLMNTPGFSDLDFSSLKVTLGGGMAVQRAVAERWQNVTGVPIVEAYGLTETSPGVCINLFDVQEFNGSIGLPIPSTECSIQDKDGHPVPPGEAGELCVRGPQVMKGYWNNKEETAKVFSADGWLRTGDIATMDAHGFFRIVDRKKDLILVSGFNVYPNEIEEVVAGHPGILEAGAIGVPDPKTDEAVKLIVVRKQPDLTTESVREYCKQNLTSYKVPKYVEFCNELPKTNVGKILRRELRELYGSV